MSISYFFFYIATLIVIFTILLCIFSDNFINKKKIIGVIVGVFVFITSTSFLLYDFLYKKETMINIEKLQKLPNLKTLSKIEKYLKENPKDSKGLALLAKSYISRANLLQHKSEYIRALQSYYKLFKLQPENQNIALTLAQIMTFINYSEYQEIPPTYYFLAKILESNPNNLQALSLSAYTMLQHGYLQKAKDFYNKTLKLIPKNDRRFIEIKKNIQNITDKENNNKPKIKIKINITSKIKITNTTYIFLLFKNNKKAKPFLIKPIPANFLPMSINITSEELELTQKPLNKGIIMVSYISKSGFIKDISSEIINKDIKSINNKLVINF